jgi:cell volume regulation protein A
VLAAVEATELDVESAPLEDLHAVMLQTEIPEGSKMHGVELWELRLPEGASMSLVVRNGAGFVPERTTRLQVGDRLVIVAASRVRRETERRLRAVSRAGKLAHWHGERGD